MVLASVAAPFLWNELPVNFKNSNTVEQFKSGLKTLLFKQAFNLYYKITFWKRELWLVKSRVSITMENMERFTPLYAIAYAITNSMENLRFDKEDYFHVLVFYGLFYKRNTCGSLRELEIAWKYSPYRLVFPLQFLVLPNFHWCFYNCMETRKMFSIS